MKQIKNLIVLALFGIFIFTSCDTDETIPGHDLTQGPAILGWAKDSETLSYFSDEGVINNMYAVDLLGNGDGSPTNSDISVSISVDPSSTAINGQEYTLPVSGVTLSAGDAFTQVPVDINTGGFNPSTPTFLLLNIETTTNDAVVSTLASQLKINFVGCKATLGANTYMMTVTSDYGTQYGPVIETVSELSVNSFRTYSVGTWGYSPFNIGAGIKFEVICDEIIMPDQELADTYSNAVKHAGNDYVDPVTGNFTINYSIDFSSGPAYYVATFIKQ